MNPPLNSPIASTMETLRKPGFWVLVVSLLAITTLHYWEAASFPKFLIYLIDGLGLQRHSFERILYLIPIFFGGFLYDRKGALTISLVALACMLPRAVLLSQYPRDALFESSAVVIVGVLISFLFYTLRRERTRRLQLVTLYRASSAISQSLEMDELLGGSISNAVDLVSARAAVLLLLDENTGELSPAACIGMTQERVQKMNCLMAEGGPFAQACEGGDPVYMRDVISSQSTVELLSMYQELESSLIVPLRSKGKAIGVLCVIPRGHRRFSQSEVELLNAIGYHIGVAVENTRLCEREWQVSESLAASEERYRELFESARDAIWVHDLEDRIIVANKAFVELTGYRLRELRTIRAPDLIACEHSIKEIGNPFLRGEAMSKLSEVQLVKKDGSMADIQFSTSPLYVGGKVVGFQHMARDVTEEKRLRENIRFYARQIARAQEEERKRIARELHDETIQALVIASRELDNLSSECDQLYDEDKGKLEKVREQINDVMEDVRRTSQDLRPATLDQLGLLSALESFISDIKERAGIAIQLDTSGTERRLSQEGELTLFRIAQEALTNVWRHSQATSVIVQLDFHNSKIRLSVSDNGVGFELPNTTSDLVKVGRLGLTGMEERAQLLMGTLIIDTCLGKGTTVCAEIPV
ncbi:PAS domain S-box protein [Chloroflexota bacterium]